MRMIIVYKALKNASKYLDIRYNMRA